MKRPSLIALLIVVAAMGAAAGRADTLSVPIRPDQTGVCLPLYTKGEPGRLIGRLGGKDVTVPGQAIPLAGGEHAIVYLLPPATEAGAQTWRREPAASEVDPWGMEMQPDGRLDVTEEGKPVLTLNFGPQLKEGVAERYRRSDYIHPLYGIDGVVLSDDFPKDHYHHRGLFWSWSEVKVGEKTYDPWACVGMEARFMRWLARETGPVCAVVGMENGWYVGEKSAVRETVWAYVYRATPEGRVLDVSITLEAEDEPVPLRGRPDGNKGYGGFNLRFAPRRNADVTMPTGRLKADAVQAVSPWADRLKGDAVQVASPWADYSGRFGKDEAVSGVAIFDHTRNPSHPTTWLTRYYGVLNPTWPALQWTTLEKGKPVTLRYRLWIHRGSVTEAKVANMWSIYSQPPAAEVK